MGEWGRCPSPSTDAQTRNTILNSGTTANLQHDTWYPWYYFGSMCCGSKDCCHWHCTTIRGRKTDAQRRKFAYNAAAAAAALKRVCLKTLERLLSAHPVQAVRSWRRWEACSCCACRTGQTLDHTCSRRDKGRMNSTRENKKVMQIASLSPQRGRCCVRRTFRVVSNATFGADHHREQTIPDPPNTIRH